MHLRQGQWLRVRYTSILGAGAGAGPGAEAGDGLMAGAVGGEDDEGDWEEWDSGDWEEWDSGDWGEQ